MKRPLKKRIWFYKPNPGYLIPEEGLSYPDDWWKFWQRGSDEFNWHTMAIGHVATGQVVFAIKPCPKTGDCAEIANELSDIFSAEWPVDAYGHNHIKCLNEYCYCRDEDDLEL